MDDFSLPEGWKQTLPEQDHKWVSKALLKYNVLWSCDLTWARCGFILPSQTLVSTSHPLDRYFTHRLFLWLPRRLWCVHLTCPACDGHELTLGGLYRIVRQVLDHSNFYYLTTDKLECGNCKKQYSSWSGAILNQLEGIAASSLLCSRNGERHSLMLSSSMPCYSLTKWQYCSMWFILFSVSFLLISVMHVTRGCSATCATTVWATVPHSSATSWKRHTRRSGSMVPGRVCVQLQHLGQFWPYVTSVNLLNWNTDIRRHLDHWTTTIGLALDSLCTSSVFGALIELNSRIYPITWICWPTFRTGMGPLWDAPWQLPQADGWPSPPRSQTPCITETAAEDTMTVTNFY